MSKRFLATPLKIRIVYVVKFILIARNKIPGSFLALPFLFPKAVSIAIRHLSAMATKLRRENRDYHSTLEIEDGTWWLTREQLPHNRNWMHPYFEPGDGEVLSRSLNESVGVKAQLNSCHMPFVLMHAHWSGVKVIGPIASASRELSNGKVDHGALTIARVGRATMVRDVYVALQRNGTNYNHFITEVLPSLLAWDSKMSIRGKIAVPGSKFAAPLLQLVGLGKPAALIDLPSVVYGRDVTLLRLLPVGYLNKDLLQEVSRRVVLATSGVKSAVNNGEAHSEVFLSRLQCEGRNLTNEEEVIEVIRERFPSLDVIYPGNLSVEEQVCRMANARLVIAPHGAQVTNILWAPRLEHLIEISALGKDNPALGALAAAIGSDIHYVSSSPLKPGDEWSNHKCDISQLKSILERL